ncbi:MAG: chitobiase/beta-hexosaminidase C-terminal domain-containing protein [Cyclonatronaceae bacterium]
MIRKLRNLTLALMVVAIAGTDLLAQQQVTIRDLNTYDPMPLSQEDLSAHPLTGVQVEFTAVIVSYPRSSGLAGYNSTTGTINRIHVFVADTTALENGLDGNFMQIVVDGAGFNVLENLNRGDVITVVGALGWFGAVGQFNSSDITLIGSALFDPEFEKFLPLLEPTTIELSELNIPSEEVDGTFKWNRENYTKYINRYVRFEGVEVIDRLEAETGRPRLFTSDGVSPIMTRDVSLRYRNDRNDNYRDGYNYRRAAVDGPYVPPPSGAVVEQSGFIVMDTFDPNNIDESTIARTFRIAPMEDGVVWIGEGDDVERFEPENWPNDLRVLGFAALLDNLTQTPEEVFEGDEVSVSINVDLPEVDYTLNSVTITYTAGDAGAVTEDMTGAGNLYSYTFPEFDVFTMVNYTITATTTTPDDIVTRARQSSSFYVLSETQTAPPIFSPAAGTYANSVTVSISSMTENATIFYTTDGSDPTDESDEYSTALTFDQTTTLRAIAFADGLDASPVTSAVYTIEVDAIEVDNLNDLRAAAAATTYLYTGEAVVTYARSSRNQKYLMDSSGGILIDDNPGIFTTPASIGDVFTGLLGQVSDFRTLKQFNPSVDPGAPVNTGVEITPMVVTLSDIDPAIHQSMLVRVDNVTFVSAGTFAGGQNYFITDESIGEETVTLRTAFGEADYIDTPIPTGAVNLTVLVGSFDGTVQVTPRFSSDIQDATNLDRTDRPFEFGLAQNYPNPFNPTTNIVYTLAETSDVRLVVYDILGRRVASLVNETQMAGQYNVNFDAVRLASGTYLYRLEAGDFTSVKKMMLIK